MINHTGWSNVKDIEEMKKRVADLSAVLNKTLIPVIQRAAFAMNELGEAMYRVAEKEYLKYHKRLPGGTNSVRLRKKRRTLVIRWFYKKSNIKYQRTRG